MIQNVFLNVYFDLSLISGKHFKSQVLMRKIMDPNKFFDYLNLENVPCFASNFDYKVFTKLLFRPSILLSVSGINVEYLLYPLMCNYIIEII